MTVSTESSSLRVYPFGDEWEWINESYLPTDSDSPSGPFTCAFVCLSLSHGFGNSTSTLLHYFMDMRIGHQLQIQRRFKILNVLDICCWEGNDEEGNSAKTFLKTHQRMCVLTGFAAWRVVNEQQEFDMERRPIHGQPRTKSRLSAIRPADHHLEAISIYLYLCWLTGYTCVLKKYCLWFQFFTCTQQVRSWRVYSPRIF